MARRSKRFTKDGRSDQTSKMESAVESTEQQQPKSESGFGGSFYKQWFDANPDLTYAAGNLPTPFRPGARITAGALVNDVTGGLVNTKATLGGIMAIHWVPNLGKGLDSKDPINATSAQIYARVRANYSGSLAADGPDMIVYMCAITSLMSYIATLKRIYRVVSRYNANNRYLPKGVLLALGVPLEQHKNLVDQKTRLFGYINELVKMSRNFKFPNFFPMTNRHYWMSDNAYMDANSINAQMYVFVQDSYWMFSMEPTQDDPSIKAGGLIYKGFPTAPATDNDYVGTLFDFGAALYNAIASEETNFTINGYFEGAFPDYPVFDAGDLLLEEIFDPIYDEEVLAEIENSFGVGDTFVGTAIVQDVSNGLVISTPVAQVTAAARRAVGLPVLSLRSDIPSLEMIVDCTRLMTYLSTDTLGPVTAGDAIQPEIIAGTEIVTTRNIVVYDPLTGQLTNTDCPWIVNGITLSTQLATTIQWDWCPRTLYFYVNSNAVILSWDIHNTTVIAEDQIREINRVCLYSELGTFTKR